jgi:hypothetical protein
VSGDPVVECHWPFHNDKACTTCAEYERLYAEGVDDWLRQKQEIRAAARAERAARRKTTPRTGSV